MTKSLYHIALSLSLLLCQASPSLANNLTTATIPSINSHVLSNRIAHADPQHTAVILDIDNTLLTVKTKDGLVGGPDWFEWQSNATNQHQPTAIAHSFPQLLDFNAFVLNHLHSVRCEPNTAPFIHHLIKRGFTVIAATARAPEVHQATAAALQQAGIVLSPTSKPLQRLNGHRVSANTLFSQGILYLKGQSKAVMVKKLFDKSGQLQRYTHIIYLDDTLNNLVDFTQHYNTTTPRTQARVDTFHYTHEQWQHRYFQQLLKHSHLVQQRDAELVTQYRQEQQSNQQQKQ